MPHGISDPEWARVKATSLDDYMKKIKKEREDVLAQSVKESVEKTAEIIPEIEVIIPEIEVEEKDDPLDVVGVEIEKSKPTIGKITKRGRPAKKGGKK